MLRSDFDYELPPESIAQEPPAQRGASRLLVLKPSAAAGEAKDEAMDDAKGEALSDRHIADLPELLLPGDLLVFNDTRVVPARLHGRKASGGAVELLLERLLDEHSAWVRLRASHAPKPGSWLHFDPEGAAQVIEREQDLFHVRFDRPIQPFLEEHGQVPLPPYIRREPTAQDRARYQTLFARHPGSAAAPTAGLHFDEPLLEALRKRGVEAAFLTLHVGAGTYAPVRSERIEEHRLHAERVQVDGNLCQAVAAARARGGRVIAVGTTAVRALESAAAGSPADGELAPFAGETRLFIYPGYRFRVVQGMITNFHLPQSSLLMLVCAFAGREPVLAAYRHAVRSGYRFFSYGDAMLVWPT